MDLSELKRICEARAVERARTAPFRVSVGRKIVSMVRPKHALMPATVAGEPFARRLLSMLSQHAVAERAEGLVKAELAGLIARLLANPESELHKLVLLVSERGLRAGYGLIEPTAKQLAQLTLHWAVKIQPSYVFVDSQLTVYITMDAAQYWQRKYDRNAKRAARRSVELTRHSVELAAQRAQFDAQHVDSTGQWTVPPAPIAQHRRLKQ